MAIIYSFVRRQLVKLAMIYFVKAKTMFYTKIFHYFSRDAKLSHIFYDINYDYYSAGPFGRHS